MVTVVTRAGSPPSTSTPEAAAEPAISTPPISTPEPERNRCMARPSTCGYPDETNTGVPAGTPLTLVNGDVHLTTAGQMYSAARSAERSSSRPTTSPSSGYGLSRTRYPIRARSGQPDWDDHPRCRVRHGWARRCEGHRVQATTPPSGVVPQRIRLCPHRRQRRHHRLVLRSLVAVPGSDAHADGFQLDGGRNVVLRHNTIRNPNGQTSAIRCRPAPRRSTRSPSTTT